jgi:UDP-N-acetylglucosamine acyltransferase
LTIHPTAIVHPGAELGSGVRVGPYSIIEDQVVIGAGTEIGPHVVIKPFTTIGEDCRIFQFSSVGDVPQDLKFKGEETQLIIGNRNIIREYVTLNRGTAGGGGVTRLGDNNVILAYAHIAHDCIIGDNVVMSNGATLAGHIEVEDHAILGGLAAVHQFVKIGTYAIVGGKSAVAKDVPPYVIAAGNRARLYGLNLVGLKRKGFAQDTISALKRTYRLFFRSGLTIAQAQEAASRELPDIPEVNRFLAFIRKSQRGITR